jgi:hypothetical protein
MTDDMHVPAHITLTRRIAEQETAAVARLTVTERQLTAQLDEHQRDAAAERDRIEAELRAAREKAEKHLGALAETGRRLTSELQGVGRQRQQHHDEATEAQQTVLGWCTRAGISPDELPPLHDTGPLPAIQTPEPKALEMPDRCDECETTGRNCTAHGGRPGIPYTPPVDPKLPALDEPDSVLALGARMADPNATRADAGGDGPGRPFPGGMESPAEPRPKRPTRRRTQSDRVNDQDGDDQ